MGESCVHRGTVVVLGWEKGWGGGELGGAADPAGGDIGCGDTRSVGCRHCS